MPTRKKSKTIVQKKVPVIQPKESENMPLTPTPSPLRASSRLLYIVVIILIILGLLALRYRNFFVVASVNGKPISRLELENELNTKFGSQTLDNLISERIILDGAQKRGVSVSDSDVNQKMKEIEDRLKGKISLDDALKAQGLTRDSFRRQVQIQIAIDKMFSKDVNITDKEIDDFIEQNKGNLTSTDPAQLRSDVIANLKQQKIGDLFDKWFTDAKKGAKVVKYY